MTSTTPKPPSPLGAAGGRLWRSVQRDYELEAHESLLLLAACRVSDVLDGLAVVLKREGLLEATAQGRRAHPAVVEARQQSITLARLLAALRLPAGDEAETDRRPQRRAVRGVYEMTA